MTVTVWVMSLVACVRDTIPIESRTIPPLILDPSPLRPLPYE